MLETFAHQGDGLRHAAPHAGARLITMVSQGQQALEQPLLWQLCQALQAYGYPPVVLDGTSLEAAARPGLLDLLQHTPRLPGSEREADWTVMPAAAGLRQLARERVARPPLARLGRLLRGGGVVLVIARTELLAPVLLGSPAQPMLLVTPGRNAVVRGYRTLKHLHQQAGVSPALVCLGQGASGAAYARSAGRTLQECAITHLGCRVDMITVHREPDPRPAPRRHAPAGPAPAGRRRRTGQPVIRDTLTAMYTAKGHLDREHMIRQYVPLVRRLAHHMIAKLPANVELDDLIQVGMIGLSEALTRYEVAQGVQFETFATQRIRGAMIDELREGDWMSRGSRKSQKDIERAVQRAEQKLGRVAKESEIAEELGMTLTDYQDLLGKVRGTQLVYLEDMSGGDEDESFLDRHAADTEADPLSQLRDARLRTALVAAIEALPEREQYIMSMYYEKDLNLKEIAAVLGVTESRVCQLHSQAVARLRAKMRAH